jgi:phosphotransferase system enzyme I (PtsP)
VDTGDRLILDAQSGEVHVRPPPGIEQAYSEKVRFYARKQARYASLRALPAVTKDGVAIGLHINAGILADMPHLAESGADGIGLYRTELQFMLAETLPRMRLQASHYEAVLEAAGNKPVVFRTLDIGTDKHVPYLRMPKEENPAMGWRGLRMAMERPALLELQLRAMLKAASGRHLKIMFPMVAETAEFLQARRIVERAATFVASRGHKPPLSVKLGAMIEVPSLVWQLDHLLTVVDFLSIGSNDLMQFLFAFDRNHPRLQGRYDVLSPAVLALVGDIVARADRQGVPVNLCGEMAGKPVEAMALIGAGFRSISMVPAAIGPVKSMVLALDCEKLSRFLTPLLVSSEPTLRPQLLEFAQQNNIPL